MLFGKQKPFLGVAISDHALELALVTETAGGASLISHRRVVLKPGIVNRGRVRRPRDLADIFAELLQRAEPEAIDLKNVNLVFGLQDCVAQTYVFGLPPHRKNETPELVRQEVRRQVSLPPDSLVYDFRATYHGDGATVVVIATTIDVLDEWQSFFSTLDVDVRQIAVESLATFRGIFANAPDSAVCMVDIGQQASSVSLYFDHQLQYRYLIDFGGDNLTSAYADKLELSIAQAEKHKLKVGIGCGDEPERQIATKELEVLVKETTTALQLYKRMLGQAPTEVVLVGGSAQLTGLVEYMSDTLGVEVKVGQSVFAPQLRPQKISGTAGRGATEQEIYIQAIGYGLLGVDSYWSDLHPSFELDSLDDGVSQTTSGGMARFIKFAMVVAVLALASGAAWVYWQEKNMVTPISQPAPLVEEKIYSTEQKINLELMVTLGQTAPGEVAGRVVKSTRTTATSSTEARQSAFDIAKAEVKPDETLVVNDLGQNSAEQDNPIFSWLIYNTEGANLAVKATIDLLNTNKLPYSLKQVNPVSAVLLENGAYKLTVEAVLVVDQLLTIEQTPIAVAEVKPEVEEKPKYEIPARAPRVVIGSTPTGFLNARAEASTGAELVAKLEPGQEYEFIEENKFGWYKIKLDAKTFAWIAGQYAVKK